MFRPTFQCTLNCCTVSSSNNQVPTKPLLPNAKFTFQNSYRQATEFFGRRIFMPILRFSDLVSIISVWRNDCLVFVMNTDITFPVQQELKLLYNRAKYTKVSLQKISDIFSRKYYHAVWSVGLRPAFLLELRIGNLQRARTFVCGAFCVLCR